MIALPDQKDQLPNTMSLRARKGVAISRDYLRIRTPYQEIATGFALAMTM